MYIDNCHDCGCDINWLYDEGHMMNGNFLCDGCYTSHHKLQEHYYNLVPFCPVHNMSDYNHLRRPNVQYEWANLSVFEQNIRKYKRRELKILTDRARKASRRP